MLPATSINTPMIANSLPGNPVGASMLMLLRSGSGLMMIGNRFD